MATTAARAIAGSCTEPVGIAPPVWEGNAARDDEEWATEDSEDELEDIEDNEDMVMTLDEAFEEVETTVVGIETALEVPEVRVDRGLDVALRQPVDPG